MLHSFLRVLLVGWLVVWGTQQARGQRSQPSADVAFYIVAHQDDWQLFMGSDAYDDAQKPNRKVVFVCITAGQGWSTGSAYWQGREAGAVAAMQAAVDGSPASPRPLVGVSTTVAGHSVVAYHYKQATSYFLRLPDGKTDGSGFASTTNQSLRKLRAGTDSLVSVDRTTTYRNWSELVGTLRTLLQQEAAGARSITVHCPDASSTHNPGDHSDHVFSGRLAQGASAVLECQVVQHVGYDSQLRAKNLSSVQEAHQRMLYAANCQAMVANGLQDYRDESHQRFLGRQYTRLYHHSLTTPRPTATLRPDTTATGTRVALLPAYPNPFSESSLLRYSLPATADVSIRILTLQGDVVRTVVQARQPAGTYQVWLDVGQFPAAGQYICQLQAGQEHQQCRIELVR